MNDVMHVVAKVWYRLYWGVVLFFSVIIAAFSLAAAFIPNLSELGTNFGLNTFMLIASTAVILYCATVYWLLDRRSPAMAMFGATLLFTLVIVGGLTLSDSLIGRWFYVGGWLVNTAFAGMYGTPTILGAILVGCLFVSVHSEFNFASVSPELWIVVLSTLILGGAGYLFWRNKFSDPVDRQLSQLTGMLQSNQVQSAILIQSIADGVIVTNTEGKITLINPAAATMTDWQIGEAAGIDVELVAKLNKENGEDLLPDENPFTIVLARKQRLSQTLQLTSRKGRKQSISLVISPVIIPGGSVGGAVAVIRDISAQRAAEQQRAEFISTASHEMRTPVAAIEGYLSLALNDKVSTLDSRARSYLEKAHASTQHLGQLFQDLLTSAKAEDGRLSNHPSIVEMGGFLQQLMEDLKFSAQKKGLSTEFIVGSSDAIDATKEDPDGKKLVKPLYYVYVDQDRIREVITNLFDNAVKYTDQGKVTIGLTGNNEVVQLYIRDTGNGIPAEDIPHLFQKFYRVDNSATRTVGGTGLGLFIARKIIELYQGRIWVESKLGTGSTFFINLPRIGTQKAQQLMQRSSTNTSTQLEK